MEIKQEQPYNFLTYDRNKLRGSILRSNKNFHFVMEKLFVDILPKEIEREALLRCGQAFMNFKEDIMPTNCDGRVRVSFEGSKKALTENGLWSADDPRLKDCLLGGMCNVGSTGLGQTSLTMLGALVCHWILLGPLFI